MGNSASSKNISGGGIAIDDNHMANMAHIHAHAFRMAWLTEMGIAYDRGSGDKIAKSKLNDFTFVKFLNYWSIFCSPEVSMLESKKS